MTKSEPQPTTEALLGFWKQSLGKILCLNVALNQFRLTHTYIFPRQVYSSSDWNWPIISESTWYDKASSVGGKNYMTL